MSKTYINGAVITVRRPGGEIEEIINTQHARDGAIPAPVFAAMVKQTAAAGRGNILSQRPNVVAFSLSIQRAEISGKLAALSGNFPSADKAREESALTAELAAFDAAFPEVLVELQAARQKRTANGVDRAAKMED